MQLGSGSWVPVIGMTYFGKIDKFLWGLQSKYKMSLQNNSENYKLGNRLDVLGWGAIRVSHKMSVSTTLSFYKKNKIEGVDVNLKPKMMPLFNTLNSGREQLDLGIGTNLSLPLGSKNIRLAAEFKIPVYQRVNGIQMKNSFMTIFGLQYTIGNK